MYVRDRTLPEISCDEGIGGFKAHDFFGDGSFYILDAPGHAVGHICGLARTSPTTFFFMDGDFCHFAGTFRSISGAPSFFCPCAPPLLSSTGVLDHRPNEGSFYQVSTGANSGYHDPSVAEKSVETLKSSDADPSVFICLAHDNISLKILPLFKICPEGDIND
ncbi:uncharacterized protein N7529_002672 [Penicillium soppii]|uniref:uncharacterized protein n=1 Tax=Penicillium soppii TaxID=69789 RepID=UPI0025467EA7|nr:uncharacterized protein N7529_002672 [Penicillium soppii]KAJ5874242.1 hypothetical protein N7529_002672 [Penicillium soppii]